MKEYILKKIDNFRGEYFFLSNFYPLPSGKTLEHYYQAEKTDNLIWKFYILESKTASEAKKRGRKAPLKKSWDDLKTNIMYNLVYAKFSLYPSLNEKLLDTDDLYLEEGNDWGDRFWGTVNGEGENFLGIILMVVRKSLRK